MRTYNHIKIVIVLFALFLIPAEVKAQRDLLIHGFGQGGQNTCWAACAIMVLRAYDRNNTTSELEMRRWVFGTGLPSTDLPNALSGDPKATDMVIRNFSSNPVIESYSINTGAVPGCGGEGCISQSMLTSTIDDGRPMIAGVTTADSYHAVVIRGYTGSGGSNVGRVIYNEPRFNGQRREMLYSDFVAGNEWFWDETLMITSKPREAIPVGVGPNEHVRILDNNSTTQITQSPQNLTFRAWKYGPHVPVNWNWRLVFPHAGGDYVLTWSVTSSAIQSTWSIPNFVLPSNFKWKYNFDGKIPGRVEVLVNDNAGPPAHEDAMNVLYVPNDLYPGVIVYENRTISTPQPEVKAHELIIIKNSQLLPGSHINFRSGERIDIKAGTNINIQGGGSVNFVVDPSIR